MAIRDRVRAIDDITREVVEIPEWTDGEGIVQVEVRSLTLGVRNKIAIQSRDRKTQKTDTTRFYPKLVIAASYEPGTNQKAFEPDDESWLTEKNAAALDRLAKVALRLSGMAEEPTDEDDTDAGQEAIDEAGKDSSSTETSELGS
jgi:hypothetical protein